MPPPTISTSQEGHSAGNALGYYGRWLEQDEYDQWKLAFDEIDAEHTGSIQTAQIKQIFKKIGGRDHLTEEDWEDIFASAHINPAGTITFPEMLKVVELSGETVDQEAQAESDTLMAFISLGGDAQKTGFVDAEKLKKIVQDFDLDLDVDALLASIDENGDGQISYDEFKTILSHPKSGGGQQTSPFQGTPSPFRRRLPPKEPRFLI